MSINMLNKYAADFDIELNDDAIKRFDIYLKLLVEWNKKINLTAILEHEQILIKHFLDSLLLTKATEIKNDAKLIDIGTGAGFPGVPVKIANPNVNLVLLDSLNKRLKFLEELLRELSLEATIIHQRAEEGAKNKNLRECFDVVTSRAVAPLNVLSEYCLPYVKLGGCFAAMKGPALEDEMKTAERAIEVLGGKVETVNKFQLPDESKRFIVVIRKVNKTPEEYPRHGSKISKKAL